MNVYHLRTIADDYPQLIAIGVLLGVIHQPEGVICTVDPSDYWDYIGPIVKDGLVKCDPDGNEYIHVNLLTKTNLADAAAELAADHPEVADGLDNLGRYFLLDEEGNARAPAKPYRVFAS